MIKSGVTNKKIFLLGPNCLSYDRFLINKLIDLGYMVDTFDLYLKGLHFRVINKFKLDKVEEFKEEYYNNALNYKNYDIVLVREGQQLSSAFYENLRSVNPNAQFINFHWDSLKPTYDYLSKIKYFDKVYSFDYKDCKNNREINYLPLFCIDEYLRGRSHNTQFKYDLAFVGAWRNEERVKLIELTEKECLRQNLSFFPYLYSSLWEQLWLIRTGRKPKKAKSKQLSHKEIFELFSISNTIIDFPSSFQTGLTIRTFEALGAGKKLITTNKNITNEPFYNPEYISVLDVDNFNLDIEFLKHAPQTSIRETMKDYSIENYIFKLLKT